MKIGYARVSTQDQDIQLQIDALNADGCERIYQDVVSGSKAARPGLDGLLSHLRPGDTVVVWKLDRLGRSLKHLIETVSGFEDTGVGFRSITEGIDTTTPAGKLVFHIFASLAEFERALIIERTKAGLESARARGRVGGNRAVDIPDAAREAMISLYDNHAENKMTVEDIVKPYGISRSTFYKYVYPLTKSGKKKNGK